MASPDSPRRARLALVVLVIAAMGFTSSGCGGGDDDDSAPNSNTNKASLTESLSDSDLSTLQQIHRSLLKSNATLRAWAAGYQRAARTHSAEEFLRRAESFVNAGQRR